MSSQNFRSEFIQMRRNQSEYKEPLNEIRGEEFLGVKKCKSRLFMIGALFIKRKKSENGLDDLNFWYIHFKDLNWSQKLTKKRKIGRKINWSKNANYSYQ